MSRISSNLGRTTSLLRGDRLYGDLRDTQQKLFEAQNQISTGKAVQRPSDAPGKAASILRLQGQLSARDQHERNLDHAVNVLNNTDQALSDATDLLREAHSTASGQIGPGADAASRASQGRVVGTQLDALVRIANRQAGGVPLFGGDQGTPRDGRLFENFLGGIRYRGSTRDLRADVGADAQPFNTNGLEALGALSARVRSQVDLSPAADAQTSVVDVSGATGRGVEKGPVRLVVDGTQVNVDLTDIDTLGDAATRINDAITGVDPTAGSLTLTGGAFKLDAAAGHDLAVQEAGGGRTAADLGLGLNAANGGSAVGTNVSPRLTPTTPLSDLDPSIDWTSGLTVKQGQAVGVADFSDARNVQDLINAVGKLNLGVRLEINQAGDGLNLINEVSGPTLSISENGGTTAADLGLRTFGNDTRLSSFRDGRGVGDRKGEDDFSVSLHDGTSFKVNLDGISTVGGLIGAVNNAASAAGLTVGADFEAGLAQTGSGLVFTDNTTGGDFQVADLGQGQAAAHLGIEKDAGAASTLRGDDHAGVRVHSVFTTMVDLRHALADNDASGITFAAGRMEPALDKLVQSRADVGATAKQAKQRQSRSQDLKLMEKSMLSDLQDADLTRVISRFTRLQQQLQASMRVGAQNMQMSLLDFLR